MTHKVCVAYAPFSNGKVEKVMRELKELLQLTLMALGNEGKHWTTVLHQVQYMMNATPKVSLRGAAPTELHFGLKQTNPLESVFNIDEPDLRTTHLLSTTEIHDAVKALDKRLEQWSTKTLKQRKSKEEARGLLPNLIPGDWVLVTRLGASRRRKLFAQYKGPYLVVEVLSPFVYKVRDLITKKERRVHAKHVRFFSEKERNVDARTEIDALLAHDNDGHYAESIERHSVTEGGHFELQVKWRDLLTGTE